MPEIVYVLINEAMEGLVKIGHTHTSLEQRIRQLDTTGVPLPFQCFHAAEVNDSVLVEGRLHRIFVDKRIRKNREFFRVDPNQVREAIQLAELRDVTPRFDVVDDAEDIQAMRNAAVAGERRARLKFSELDIPIGATLNFALDTAITCQVVADGKVNFEGETLSSSAAALIAVRRKGYQWVAVSGSSYWLYDDGSIMESLVARRLRLEGD
jgi:hypothetical protein